MARKKVHWRAPKMVHGFDDGSLEAKTVHWRVPKKVHWIAGSDDMLAKHRTSGPASLDGTTPWRQSTGATPSETSKRSSKMEGVERGVSVFGAMQIKK